MINYNFEISGLVQGVGFRPFVYSLAIRYGLKGEIYNDDEGVKLSLYGKEKALLSFEKALFAELVPLARIDELRKFKGDKVFDELNIIASRSAQKAAAILPDFAICKECEREFYDRSNPRYLYPFINCTNCGPRFSIIKSLPYDRINTTMNEFKMCESCESEYKNPLDRRYHAQPISCPKCGPKFMLKDKVGKILTQNEDSIKQATQLIKDGKILAIKGLGGFHLVCDAHNQNAINALRLRKHRPHKPFAIMCKNLQNVKELAEISSKEEELLTSNLKPIVLLKAKPNSTLAPSIAPNLNRLGIMLAFSGIHLALFEYLDTNIVATSANISGEPVIYNEAELLYKLGDVIDFYLDHDRQIYSPSDDSIAFTVQEEINFTRTSRGLNPYFFHSNFNKKGAFLALGAELKNQFAIYHNGQIMISPYIGDLKNVATFDRFLNVLNLFVKTYELKFDHVICDLHPHFLNTKWAKEQGFTLSAIQHHYAHLLAVMFEHNLPKDGEYIGFCFDGTGYGEDGKIWGGEVLKIDQNGYKRLYCFDEFKLIGGENSIKNIYQIAYSIILKYDLEDEAREFLSKFDAKRLLALKTAHNVTNIHTSSLGRVFDAFASVILGLESISYEAQSGMELDKFYDESLDYSYKFEIKNGVINFKNAFKSALKDDAKHAVTGFINAIADLVTQVSKEGKKDVLLSGGVFQNSTLLSRVIRNLKDKNINFYHCSKFCDNDTNIALGQIYYLLSKI
ncbi:carbamoyltransferase HypF [Campylobacter sp. 7477a]|uniref:carbamoyltransferase HypF n=1 Tax=Campylobacter sp. 7477a TaxID=2735741 RepID=UPI0030148DB9|nr:carbamoyltransferase HypF [Campylobacter sp. 7477a]